MVALNPVKESQENYSAAGAVCHFNSIVEIHEFFFIIAMYCNIYIYI